MDLMNAHTQADWPLGPPWVDETQTDGADGSHIEVLTPNERLGHYTYGAALERTHNGITEVWPLTQANNPFTPPSV